MKMLKKQNLKIIKMRISLIVFIVYLVALVSCNFKQDQNLDQEQTSLNFEEKLRQLVLSENNLNREYYIKEETEGVLEYSVTYLGNIVNNQQDTLRFVNFITFSGNYQDSKRSMSLFYIYNSNYQPIGAYYVGGGTSGVPDGIVGDSLLFNSKVKDGSDCNVITKINFKDSIPSQIFIRCTKDWDSYFGDIYNFSKEQ